ncbi:MAG: efflux RND transporter permease subunit, partial [Caulobacteraceae bacterium]
MLGRVIHWCLLRPWVVVLTGLALLAGGLWWTRDLPAEVFPALSPAQTIVQTEAPGLVAEQVEQLVTRPVENALGGAPGVASVRSQSVQGLSVVTLDIAAGSLPGPIRQTVVERLAQAGGTLPAGVAAPRIAPLTATTGDVLKIGFTSRTLDPMALRNLIQWTVRPRLLATAGVANVALYGGQVRRVEVRARPGDLSDSDLGFADVVQAVRRATSVAGAGFMDTPSQRIVIDPRGQALTAADVAAGQIQTPGNAPVRIGDVADVVDAPAPATGDALIMGQPGVLAEVSAVYGANTLKTTAAVERTLDILRPALAAQGVTVTANLDRPADFIVGSLRTLGLDLAMGAALIGLCSAGGFARPARGDPVPADHSPVAGGRPGGDETGGADAQRHDARRPVRRARRGHRRRGAGRREHRRTPARMRARAPRPDRRHPPRPDGCAHAGDLRHPADRHRPLAPAPGPRPVRRPDLAPGVHGHRRRPGFAGGVGLLHPGPGAAASARRETRARARLCAAGAGRVTPT